MTARRSGRDTSSSLFPFLSVLACVIGTLTLLIAALALGQLTEDLLDTTDSPEAREMLAADRASLRKLELDLDETLRVGEEIAAAKAELRALGISPDTSEAERRRQVEARLEAAALSSQLAVLRREAKGLDEALSGLTTKLTTHHTPSDVTAPIRILPHGEARALTPFFIECREEGVRIYHRDLDESLYLSRADPSDTSAYRLFLARVREVPSGTAIFLIRPDGIETYHWARQVAGQLYVRHAKLPLPGQGELDFAL